MAGNAECPAWQDGRYSVTLGSTTSGGLPEDVFVSGEARWLAVQIQGQNEQSRVLLVAVPYALKSQDAETLGGLPASAFLLAAPPSNAASAAASTASSDSSTGPPPATNTGSGSAGFLPDFTGAATIGNSAVFQTGVSPTAKIGINTAAPATGLDVLGTGTIRGIFTLPATGVATAVTGKNSQPENWVASAFNSGRSTAVTQTFQLKAEPVGNNTATASASLNLRFGQGTNAPAETGLKISSKGIFTFVAGQTFPGTGPGTVSSIGSGAEGLTGGPITTSGDFEHRTRRCDQRHAAESLVDSRRRRRSNWRWLGGIGGYYDAELGHHESAAIEHGQYLYWESECDRKPHGQRSSARRPGWVDVKRRNWSNDADFL